MSDRSSGRRSLRSHVTLALIVVVLLSTVTVGAVNLFAARELLESGSQEQLSSIGQSRARRIEAGAQRLEGTVSALAADLGVAFALEELTAGYNQITEPLDSDQEAQLERFYQERVVEPIEEAGLGPITVDELLPTTPAGRYVQYHYTVAPSAAGADPEEVVDAGDGSAYSTAHADHHGFLSEIAASTPAVGNVLLISDTGDVVYSAVKGLDLGTNVVSGPYRDSSLAVTLTERLSRVANGESVIADWEFYLPSGGRPTLFVAAAVRRGTDVVGAFAMELSSDALSAITTANGNWELVGLQDGESYVVGPDLLLRSESRLWIEDPQSYLEQIADQRLAELIEIFESPVGLQPVDTPAARAALNGSSFDGRTTNYLGQDTYSSARSIDVEGVDWVVVVDTPIATTREELYQYLLRMGIVLLVMLPTAGVIAYVLGGRLSRPIPPVVDAAKAVAEGDRNPSLGTLGRDEVGDLGRRLQRTANELGRQEDELEAEFQRKRNLLLSVLPARLVDPKGDVDSGGELVETATAIAVSLDAIARGATDPEGSTLVDVLDAVRESAESLATEQGIEPVRLSADRHLFLAGIGSESDGVDDGLAFASQFVDAAKTKAESEGINLAVHVGLSTGSVASGVLDQGSLTFGAWGDPVRRALAIAALSRGDEILIDLSTAEAAEPDRHPLYPADDTVSLDGSSMDLMALRADSIDRARSI